MTKFKITSISSEVRVREVNPYGEKPEFNYNESAFSVPYSDKLKHWQEAESQLQEYPLTEESEVKIKHSWGLSYFNNSEGCMLTQDYLERKIGQLISGEIVEENGTKKIKL